MAAENMGITIERNAPESRLNELGVPNWFKRPTPIPPSRFPWEYDAKELTYINEGRVRVYPDGPHTKDEYVELTKGDYAMFPKGLKCIWDVSEAIEKQYVKEY